MYRGRISRPRDNNNGGFQHKSNFEQKESHICVKSSGQSVQWHACIGCLRGDGFESAVPKPNHDRSYYTIVTFLLLCYLGPQDLIKTNANCHCKITETSL